MGVDDPSLQVRCPGTPARGFGLSMKHEPPISARPIRYVAGRPTGVRTRGVLRSRPSQQLRVRRFEGPSSLEFHGVATPRIDRRGAVLAVRRDLRGSAASRPTGPTVIGWVTSTVEDRKTTTPDPEQRTLLEGALIDAVEALTDLTNPTEDKDESDAGVDGANFPRSPHHLATDRASSRRAFGCRRSSGMPRTRPPALDRDPGGARDRLSPNACFQTAGFDR